MERPYQITAAMCLLFAAFVAYGSFKLRLYTPMGPGPGFFPFWLSLAFGLLAVILFWQASFGGSEPMPADFFATRTGYLRIAAILVALIGTVVLLNPLGFRLTSLLFYFFLLNVLGRQGLLVSVLVACVGSFGVYHVFADWLLIPLPIGVLGI